MISALAVTGLLIMHIWNTVMFDVFAFANVSLMQALGIFLFFNLMFSPMIMLMHGKHLGCCFHKHKLTAKF